ncbi:unnamed protein product, partial [Didymodactylos carnosus]
VRKPVKQPFVSKPIISLGVTARLQIDLIDMRTRPDAISSDAAFQWILNCIDHFPKFSWAFALKNKSAVEVAKCLDEEQLPTPIEDSLDQTNVGDSNTNSPAIIENEPYALYPDDPQLDDDATSVAACLLGLSFTSVCTVPVLNPSFFIDNLISFDSPPSKNVSHVLLAPPSVIVLDNFVRGFDVLDDLNSIAA